MKLFFIYSLIPLLFISGCSNTDEDAPKKRQNFRCVIGGEELYPGELYDKEFYGVNYSVLSKGGSAYYLTIWAMNDSKRYKEVALHIYNGKNPIIPGEYKLQKSDIQNKNVSYATCYFEKSGKNKKELVHESRYNTNKEQTGVVNITEIDTLSGVLKGSFYFQAVNSLGETIIVKDGVFNTKFSI